MNPSTSESQSHSSSESEARPRAQSAPAIMQPHAPLDQNRLRHLGGNLPQVSREECESLYEYLHGGDPESAREIFDWCMNPKRNLTRVLPLIQQQYPHLLLQVFVPSNEHDCLEEIKYLATHPEVLFMLDVEVQELKDQHVAPLTTALQLRNLKCVVIRVTDNDRGMSNVKPIVSTQMEAIAATLQQHPNFIQPLDSFILDFRSAEGVQTLSIGGNWVSVLCNQAALKAKSLALGNACTGAKIQWEGMLTQLAKAQHGPARLFVQGGSLEMAEFFEDAKAVVASGLVLSCDITLSPDVWGGTWIPLDTLMSLTTGTLTIPGAFCSRRTLEWADYACTSRTVKIKSLVVQGALPDETEVNLARQAQNMPPRSSLADLLRSLQQKCDNGHGVVLIPATAWRFIFEWEDVGGHRTLLAALRMRYPRPRALQLAAYFGLQERLDTAEVPTHTIVPAAQPTKKQ
jgi:hypothetical protein